MKTFETAQPCGCVLVHDDSPVTINGADMSGIVANICDIRRCPTHQAEWDAGIKRMADHWDRKAMEKFYPTASAQGDGAGE
jgi:hypothetical protein